MLDPEIVRKAEQLRNEQRQLEKEIALCEDVTTRAELKRELVWLYYAQEQYAQAEVLLRDLIEGGIETSRAAWLLVNILGITRRYREAIEIARSFVAHNPDDFAWVLQLADKLYLAEGQVHARESSYWARRAVDINPESVRAWDLLARIYRKLRWQPEARWAAERGIAAQGEQYRDDPVVGECLEHFIRGHLALHFLSRKEVARFWASQAKQAADRSASPVWVSLCISLGRLLEAVGDYEAAHECLQFAAALNPRRGSQALGGFYLRRGQLRKVWQMFKVFKKYYYNTAS